MPAKKSETKSNTFSKLSANARLSLKYAQVIADDLFSREVTPMHLFLAIISNTDSLGSRALLAMGIDIDQVVRTFVGSKTFDLKASENRGNVAVRLSKESKDTLRIAYSLASKHSHVYVGTEHILMAILDQRDMTVSKDLASIGLNSKYFRDNLVNFATYPIGILAKPTAPESDQVSQGQLAMLGKDLVQLANEGKLDPLVGRDEELNQVINVLSRRSKNNPIIVGDPGVGKTAIVEGLAQLVAAGTVPNSLMNSRIIALDLSAIVAGSKLRGDIEEKMIAIINEVTDSTNVILFIDEIHNILGSSMVGGGMDMASVLKPALLRDDFRVIGATTTSEYTRYFEEDNALVRRFQPIFIDEPSIEETIQILKRVEPLLEKHHKVNISQESIEAAAKLSHRYVSDRFLPDKAIDLLDEAAASRRLQLEVKYKDVADVMGDYHDAVKHKEKAVLSGRMEDAKIWKKREQELKEKLEELEKKRSKSKDTAKYKVGLDTIQEVVSKWTGIPVQTIDSKETALLKDLESYLGSRVVGQEEAVESVASAIKRARTGISDADRPWATLMFLGPTGVGKTELAKVLTKLLFGDVDRLIQIDMSEMMEMHSVSKLIGSPPGYVGYREGGQLTEKIRKKPHSVILFDEIEKAHPDVLNILLQIMEYGHLTDGKGRKVNFKNTVVVLTSNIGAEDIQKDKVLGFSSALDLEEREDEKIEDAYDTMKEELLRKLKKTLRPELLNRLDDIVIFGSLTRKDARLIVKILLADLNDRLREMGVQAILSPSAIDYIVKEGFSEEYGARNLRRVLQDKVEDVLADYLLENPSVKKGNGAEKTLKFNMKNEKLQLI